MAMADIEAAHAEGPAYPTATGGHLRWPRRVIDARKGRRARSRRSGRVVIGAFPCSWADVTDGALSRFETHELIESGDLTAIAERAKGITYQPPGA
jgi:hypothetical protein